MSKETLVTWIDISGCARCNGYHHKLKFVEFRQYPDHFTHWAMCPDVHEPILCVVIDGSDDDEEANE